MDTWSSPGRVRNLVSGGRSANPFASGAKAPIKTEASPVPSNDCVRSSRSEEDWPIAATLGAAGPRKGGPLSTAFQDHQLLPQGDDFKSQIMT